ncbi:branched-chain amino acid aminotransferase ii [Phaffia rhodozyma]|uniref:Branched-chain-amino-acid aminotransferase n=1 Tax=Phaffia rhodozyma TaxID=264483 RepID=A0A0F7SPC9_PHARH|nr:branched-chain amino acid aminotransferase ii [Phaffia rhodozyma]
MTIPTEAPAWTDIDPSLLTIERNPVKSALPEQMLFGANFSDHMLIIKHVAGKGWQAPVIKPYGPLELSPASAVFHYAPSLFEGMKAYKQEGKTPRLFRPDENMARMSRSADRVALPPFNQEAVISLIKTLVKEDEHLIPPPPYSLYIRPTMIGTRPALGVGASDECMLYVIMCPVGPFFPKGFKPVSLLATTDAVRSWPGGTGQYKLALNYAPCFRPQEKAKSLGYDQNLWCLGDQITECGQMNLFVSYEDDEGVTHLITPPLNGLILPGITRASLLALARSHQKGEITLPGLPEKSKFVIEEREFGLSDLRAWSEKDALREAFGAGTAAVVCSVERIGLPTGSESKAVKDIHIPIGPTGLGPIATGLHARVTAIQEGSLEGPPGSNWSWEC